MKKKTCIDSRVSCTSVFLFPQIHYKFIFICRQTKIKRTQRKTVPHHNSSASRDSRFIKILQLPFHYVIPFVVFENIVFKLEIFLQNTQTRRPGGKSPAVNKNSFQFSVCVSDKRKLYFLLDVWKIKIIGKVSCCFAMKRNRLC